MISLESFQAAMNRSSLTITHRKPATIGQVINVILYLTACSDRLEHTLFYTIETSVVILSIIPS